jgi:hypothetical protein
MALIGYVIAERGQIKEVTGGLETTWHWAAMSSPKEVRLKK